MKNWVTIFERFESFHLNKDVGQLVVHAIEHLDVNVSLWRKEHYQDNVKYPFPVVNIKSRRPECKISPAIILKIIQNAKKIDVLNLFHFRIYSILYALIYKCCNPKGKVIIKCDFSYAHVNIKNDSALKKILFFILRRLNVIDLLLIEHRDLVEKFEKRGFNCRYTPNGVSMDFYNIEKSGEKNFLPTLIFVGKCGDKRKNAEEFIKSLASLDRTIEWKAYFLGGETEDFIHWFESNVVSSLRSRCTFFGEVSDVKIIHRIYSESHIFVMTSKQEGYPLSLAEACWVGCFPILSINSGGKDLSSRGVAEIYYDQENLSFLLNKYITDLNLTTSLGEMAEHEVKKYNDWRVLFDELKGFINE